MENKKRCLECGEKFTPYRRRQLFCSKECGHAYRYKHTPKETKGYKAKICLECEEEFNPTSGSQKYCCKACAMKAARRRHYKYLSEERKKPQAEVSKRKSGQAHTAVSAASQRWKRMSLQERSIECARFHLTYGQAQVKAMNGTLPEDFGKGVI